MAERLERGELVQVVELATQCLFAETCNDLVTVISALNVIVPYQKAVMCRLSSTSSSIAIEGFINHSYGSDWANLYVSERFEDVDPILQHASARVGAFDWTEVAPRRDERTRRFLAAAHEFGIVRGSSYSGGGRSRTQPKTLLSLAGIPIRNAEQTRAILTVLGPHLHEAYDRILQRTENGSVSAELTAREVEVLNWRQQGKTFWEIGGILGISQRTVKYHFTRIGAKLEAVSASHAVAKALRLGIIR